MPGQYEAEERLITLNTELEQEPELTTATLINCIVCDLLHQSNFTHAHFPELVDLAVVGTGLGILQSNIGFVSKSGAYWDSTQWEVAPKPFLDDKSTAYANAICAWIRGEKNPAWANELRNEIQRPMQKSLKYLFKTNDSFVAPAKNLTGYSQRDWLNAAAGNSTSTQVIAVRHFESDHQLNCEQETLLADKLRSDNRAILLHSIAAVERMKMDGESIVDELRSLVEHRDDEVAAKAMWTLTRLDKLDDLAVGVAIKMLESNARFVVFAGLFALTSLDTVPDHALQPANRRFAKALQTCDYEFIGLFAAAYNRWLEDPEAHFEDLLRNDSPEYLEMAADALQHVREQLVSLS